jgi:tryptophan synthase beta chain
MLHDSGRAEYVPPPTPKPSKQPRCLASTEGIIPALESAHAVAEVIKRAPKMKKSEVVIVNISGRGDKDIGIMRENLKRPSGESVSHRKFRYARHRRQLVVAIR